MHRKNISNKFDGFRLDGSPCLCLHAPDSKPTNHPSSYSWSFRVQKTLSVVFDPKQQIISLIFSTGRFISIVFIINSENTAPQGEARTKTHRVHLLYRI